MMNSPKHLPHVACVAICLLGLSGGRLDAQPLATFTRQSDVIYGRKVGVALTMEVLTPAERNGFGVVWVVSSSGISTEIGWTIRPSSERELG
jgi:hypothetical protein